MITLDRLRNAVLQATGFDALPPGFTLVDLVNEAHQSWASETTWSYLEGRTATVATVGAQGEYALGSNVGEVLEAWLGDADTGRIRMLAPQVFERWQSLGNAAPEAWPYGTVRWKPSTADDGEPRAHIALYPAPSVAGTLTVVYRATAVRIQATDDVLDVPLPLEPAFLEYFRAYCRGLMLPERQLVLELAAIRTSLMFRAAVTSQMPYRAIVPTLGNVGLHALDEEHWNGDDFYARRW